MRALSAACALLAGCGDTAPEVCGPATGVVERVIDGDTVVLATGERVRYLLVDTPEITLGHHDCYGSNAAAFNAALVAGQRVELAYDVDCADAYGRLLAYVTVGETDVNALLLARGYGCVLRVPPNGEARAPAYEALEARAREEGRGVWACAPVPPACR